ncbi:MAG: hypothetical protein UV76_C0002G0105 [Candidatus Nomurabacteria bacterium GW2011_GWA2_43_15]|uniref:Uncharacterized protein n=3 Tax=Candidatus Nomuraibacteriota TaxID=1752729 RepID=A0A0G1G1V3_9BACT|nr:MAG: hypothetical protein UV76_C0002G0105 [Candidatus Nomurabacteria bacterium GW2011_GWA2_43_15]KKT19853.1 MAG: hypothetical protein UW02_C0004G0030 [Candidatus Nomurabacteria bacterium GW2011_GWB1_43_7]
MERWVSGLNQQFTKLSSPKKDRGFESLPLRQKNMNNKELEKLIDKDKYQVFLYACPANVPLNFASHPWFVVNKLGSVSRWEVLFRNTPHSTKWGHLYMNFFPPFQGIEIFTFSQKYFWKGKLLGQIEGEIAKQIAEFIENSPTAYPSCNKYKSTGPNSNTYARWVLNNFPEFKAKLPWNSFGQNW